MFNTPTITDDVKADDVADAEPIDDVDVEKHIVSLTDIDGVTHAQLSDGSYLVCDPGEVYDAIKEFVDNNPSRFPS